MCVRQSNVCLGSFLSTINILIYNNLTKLTMYGIVLCNYGSVNYTQVICTLINITHNTNDNKTTISSSSSNTIIYNGKTVVSTPFNMIFKSTRLHMYMYVISDWCLSTPAVIHLRQFWYFQSDGSTRFEEMRVFCSANRTGPSRISVYVPIKSYSMSHRLNVNTNMNWSSNIQNN